MNKETIRPLLVEKLEKLMMWEDRAEREARNPTTLAWEPLALIQERWRAARLKRAEAELALWLADRQWEREEAAALESPEVQMGVEETVRAFNRLNASPTTKP